MMGLVSRADSGGGGSYIEKRYKTTECNASGITDEVGVCGTHSSWECEGQQFSDVSLTGNFGKQI